MCLWGYVPMWFDPVWCRFRSYPWRIMGFVPSVVSDDLNTFAYDANVAGSDALSPGEWHDQDGDDGETVLIFALAAVRKWLWHGPCVGQSFCFWGWAILWSLQTTFRCPLGASMTSSQILWRPGRGLTWWMLANGAFNNWGYPKWMVYNGKSHLEMEGLWVPLF